MTETTDDNLVPKLQAEIAKLKEENNKLRASNRRWMRIAGTDSHTGLPNKVFFTTAMLPQAVSTANAEGQPLGALMMAPDRLGDHNAKYGRKGGDQIVKGVADFLSENVEGDEKLVHHDGANFILLVPNGDAPRVKRRSLTLRAKAMNRQFVCGADRISLTLSFGVVSRNPTPDGTNVVIKESVEGFLRHLEVALDKAKELGGDSTFQDPENEF
ncbi:MAG: GGDEF domain-containing protein [bacterium]|nr:GGDEF domain-containing protein [bacterium]